MVPTHAAAGDAVSLDVLMLLNIVATVSGFVGLLLKFESRPTKLETHLEHLLPRRAQKVKGAR